MAPDSRGRAPVVLFVDDEERILSALRRALRREGWDILTAETAQAGLRLLDDHRVDLVVSDQKMPGMSGLQFLEKAADLRPDAARVLLTGWTESIEPDRLEAIGIRALINKPWDDLELKTTLRGLLAADGSEAGEIVRSLGPATRS